jgi:aryl-alcohol dehydrogenase-like predicted oxidoreductase
VRYRPFGKSGVAISALTLRLGDAARLEAQTARDLVLTAVDGGVNSIQIDGLSEGLRQGVQEAFAAVERRRLFVTLRVRGAPEQTLTSAFEALGLDRADLVLVHDPQGPALPSGLERDLRGVRQNDGAPGLGVATRGRIDPALLASDLLTAIAAPFNLASDLPDRQRIRDAERRGLAVLGEDFWPQALRDGGQTPPRPSLWRRRADPLADIGGYDFLHDTPGWSAEEICLAYALTEPSVTSVCVTAERPAEIERLAAVVERDLPDSIRAQIELARFSAQQREKAAPQA